MQQNLLYGPLGDGKRRLDVYRPSDAAESPLLVYLHGGAWITGSKDEYAAVGKRLARLGVATAIVDYRLSTDEAIRHPQHVDDCISAIRWVLTDAPLSWNPQRIFIAGHSAGAHIAALIAAGSEIKAAGFIGIAGIYDLPALVDRFPDYRDRFVEKAFGPEQAWESASPQNIKLLSRAPWLLIHSDADELVNPEQSQQFRDHLEEQRIPVRLIALPDGPHYEAAYSLGEPGTVTDEILQFVSSRGESDDER